MSFQKIETVSKCLLIENIHCIKTLNYNWLLEGFLSEYRVATLLCGHLAQGWQKKNSPLFLQNLSQESKRMKQFNYKGNCGDCGKGNGFTGSLTQWLSAALEGHRPGILSSLLRKRWESGYVPCLSIFTSI